MLSEFKSALADAHPSQSFVIFAGDVSKEEDVKHMVEAAVEIFGGLDVVNPCGDSRVILSGSSELICSG